MSYIVKPVLALMRTLFSTSIRIRRKQEHTSGATRVDLVCEFMFPNAPHIPQTYFPWIEFCVIEFKNTNIINPRNFERPHYGHARAGGQVESRESLAAFHRQRPNFEINALRLMQQAKKYAEVPSRPNDIVIFDWDVMATIDFDFVNFSIPDYWHRFPQMLSFEESRHNTSNNRTFRSLLLGFLIHSLRETVRHNTPANPDQL